MVGWPSGPRRQFKALVSSEAWVRIPLQSFVPVRLVGQDTRLSPVRPGFKSVCPLTYFCERQSASNKTFGSGGIRTHAPEETGALNQRLRPLGHATH